MGTGDGATGTVSSIATIPPIIGNSSALARLVDVARRFAKTPHPILLVGETGTGKEVFARNIHAWSRRRGRLVDLNCGAFPAELIEGLLFGTRAGSYTGAVDSQGLIAAAQGGTLFLDELHCLPLAGQVKLLRVLDTGEVQRLGDERPRRVRFRLVAAVQEDIRARIASGDFRHDLFQRIAGYVLELPSLAERPEDLMLLAHHFAEREGRDLHPACERVLRQQTWPGNVRELKFAIQRAAVLAEGEVITPVVLAKSLAIVPPELGMRGSVFPPDLDVLEACEKHRWHAQRAAAGLGISRITLWRRLQALGVSARAAKQQTRIVSSVRNSSRKARVP